MNRTLAVVLLGLVFGIGCLVSDTAAYNPEIDLRSIAWAIVTIVNHITVWLLASVLVGRYVARSIRQAVILGSMFGLVAMAGYYTLSAIMTAGFVYEWEVIVLIAVAIIGGAGGAVVGFTAKRFPVLLLAGILPLLLGLVLRIADGVKMGNIDMLDVIQISILVIICMAIGAQACRYIYQK